MQAALKAAEPVLLEPLMEVEVVVPEAMTGAVVGDLSARNARIEGVDKEQDRSVISARVALTQMFGYSTALRSLTEGRGTFSMHFECFDAIGS